MLELLGTKSDELDFKLFNGLCTSIKCKYYLFYVNFSKNLLVPSIFVGAGVGFCV